MALAGRVQRYSPIYYADSHANSALALADSPLGCLCLACSPVYAPLYHRPPLPAGLSVSVHRALLPAAVLLAHGPNTRIRAALPVSSHTETCFVIPANPTILRRAGLRGRDFGWHCILVTRHYTIHSDKGRLPGSDLCSNGSPIYVRRIGDDVYCLFMIRGYRLDEFAKYSFFELWPWIFFKRLAPCWPVTGILVLPRSRVFDRSSVNSRLRDSNYSRVRFYWVI